MTKAPGTDGPSRHLTKLARAAIALLSAMALLFGLQTALFFLAHPPEFVGGHLDLGSVVRVASVSGVLIAIILAALVGLVRKKWWARPVGIVLGLSLGAAALNTIIFAPSWLSWSNPFPVIGALGAALGVILLGPALAEGWRALRGGAAPRRAWAIKALLGSVLALNVVALPATDSVALLGHVSPVLYPAGPWVASSLFVALLSGIVLLARQKTVGLLWLLVTDIAVLSLTSPMDQSGIVVHYVFCAAALAAVVVSALLWRALRRAPLGSLSSHLL